MISIIIIAVITFVATFTITYIVWNRKLTNSNIQLQNLQSNDNELRARITELTNINARYQEAVNNINQCPSELERVLSANEALTYQNKNLVVQLTDCRSNGATTVRPTLNAINSQPALVGTNTVLNTQPSTQLIPQVNPQVNPQGTTQVTAQVTAQANTQVTTQPTRITDRVLLIKSLTDNKCLAYDNQGNRIIPVGDCTYTPYQLWNVVRTDNGSSTIRNVHGNKCLTLRERSVDQPELAFIDCNPQDRFSYWLSVNRGDTAGIQNLNYANMSGASACLTNNGVAICNAAADNQKLTFSQQKPVGTWGRWFTTFDINS